MGNVFFGGGKVGMKAPFVSRLPEGYTELTYIESSGTQHIDSEFKPNQNTKLILTAAYLGAVGSNIAGVRNTASDTTNRFGLITFSSTSKIGAFFRNSSIQAIGCDNAVHTFELSKSGLVVDGTSYGSANSGTFTCTYSFVLFGWNNGSGGVSATASRVYACQIYDGDTLVRDFVPCISDADGIGLFDLVEGKFYGNAGTGAFLGGEEVAA